MAAPHRGARSAALALAATFFLLGFVGATWISRIPAVQSALRLTSAQLGLALLGMPLGSVLVSLLLPRALHVSTRTVVAVSLPAAAASLVLMPLAGGTASLAMALLVFGATTGAVDVAMNAHAVQVQRRFAGSLFARWHAMWSLGGFVGAGAGGVVAGEDFSPLQHLSAVAVVVVGAGALVGRWLSPEPVQGPDPTPRSWTRDRTVLALSAASVAAFMLEVGAADWVGVFVRQVVGAAPAAAAGAFAAFALPHFVVRLFGDAIIDRLPRVRVLAGGLLVSAVGFAVVVTSTTVAQVLAGLAVSGAGVALVVPVAFAAAGSVPGVAPGAGVATSAGLSYVGWAVTPPLIGLVAGASDLRIGLLVPCLAAAVAACVSVAARRM